jgi:hypothetical protein
MWIQDTWQLRRVPLRSLDGVEPPPNGKTLILGLRPDFSADRLELTFAGAAEGQRWHGEIQARRQQASPDATPADSEPPDGVALIRRAPDVPHVVIGRVEFADESSWKADRGLQLRAGMLGASAVIELERRKCPERARGAHEARGLAVRVEDPAARDRLRRCWYSEEVRSLCNRTLLLLVLQAACLFLLAVFCGLGALQAPSGETPSQALASVGVGLGMLYAWPLVLLGLLRVLRWPQLLPAVGLATLAVTTGRGLTVWLAHFLAAGTTGATLARSKIWLLLDPVDWAFVIMGVVLCSRAWRLARAASQILPQQVQAVSTARKVWSRGLLATTGVYALALLGSSGVSRYQSSAHLLQPGVDPRREQDALLAQNQGTDQMNEGELVAAERSLRRALKLWEELTARPSAPSVYRANLARTLCNLGWIAERQDRADEAERFYARAVALADELAGDPRLDEDFEQTRDYARRSLARVRSDKANRLLDEKEQRAARKYEEAQVKAGEDDATAEALFREAIALWEEILPHAGNEKDRRSAVGQLAIAYLALAEAQRDQGKRPAEEANLRKAIGYGEKALALDPDSPLVKHNLELARRNLQKVRERPLQEEITRLCDARRYVDAADLYTKSIQKAEEEFRSGKDRDAAGRSLASRLNRFAWFLAHCPDPRVRDTRLAVKSARRATELRPEVAGYWHTLATVQYRNGDWRDSLASLEKVKARQGAFDASAWLLAAMNRHHLGQKEEARGALRKAAEWMEQQRRKGQDNAQLRARYEAMRPTIEALREEAENLIRGKKPADEACGVVSDTCIR